MVLAASGPTSCSLVLIGGQIASGKTVTAHGLADRGRGRVLPVRTALQEILGGADWDRRRLQEEGAALDQRTSGQWLLDYLMAILDPGGRVIVDAARTRIQVEPILEAISDAQLIFLAAAESTRRRRYGQAAATDAVKRSTSFDQAMTHETEIEAVTIRSMAHLQIETDDLTIEQVVDEACKFIRW